MICISLPVFNEADGLQEFLTEIRSNLRECDPLFIVINDCSTDGTASVLEKMEREGFPLVAVSNERNSGHGFTVLAGMAMAINRRPQHIILCDGDGQFLGSDIRKLYDLATSSGADIVEGVRIGRNDAWFRRLITGGTRLLVKECTGIGPRDANTPLRIMRLNVAETLKDHIPLNCMTPNLMASALARTMGLDILEVEVLSRPPRRRADHVDHWKQRVPFMPSRRLVRFVRLAGIQWVSLRKTIKNLGPRTKGTPGSHESGGGK